jgi:hypothetical protein
MYMCVKGINFVFVSMISRLDLGSDDVVFLFFIDNLGEVCWMQHYVIKFVSDLWQVSSTNKTDRLDITKILLKCRSWVIVVINEKQKYHIIRT